MTTTTGLLANHAVCAAAGARDGLRIAQFFVRDLAGADRWGRPGEPGAASARESAKFTYLSVFLSRVSRLADRFMTWSTNAAIALLAPDWRKLPSPFNHGMMTQVAEAIGSASFVANPLFNAYFYRAAIHILRRYRAPPFLVLEHRVDAARRMLASAASSDTDQTDVAFLARALIALVTTAPVARAGKLRASTPLLDSVEPNVAVYATACVALLFAEEGKPAQELDEDQFFAVVGALIAPRLPDISAAVARGDKAELIRELIDIKAMY